MTTMTENDKAALLAATDRLEGVADRLRAVAATLPGDKPLRAEILAIERSATNVRAVVEGWPDAAP